MKKLFPLALVMLLFNITGTAQSVTVSVPVAPCNNDGVITANVTGLTPPLTVSWTTTGTLGTTITHTVTGTTDALTSYSGGPVYVTVTDGTGSAFASFAGAPPMSYSLSASPAVCPAPGSISASVSGGTAPYTYQWYNRTTGSIIASGNPASLPAANYGVVITDAAGCVYGSRVSDDGGGLIDYVSFTATLTATPANCLNGTATVSAIGTGAVAPISYLWSTGATTAGISGLAKGTYNVTITDALGCVAQADSAFAPGGPTSVNVPQAITFSLPSTTTPATCIAADGAISVFPAGGTAPYSYSWSTGASTAAITGLSAGMYNVTVTDANGCTGTSSYYVSESTPITLTYTSSPSLCTSPSGNASVIASGGTPPYSYLWYTTPVHTTATITGMNAGTYNVKVTDAAGCIRTGSAIINPINIITGTFTSTSPLCTLSNGSIGFTPTGGATPYSYLWNTGATTSAIASVPKGSYTVRVTDAMGCKVNRSFALSSYSPVGIGVSSTDASCIFANDGSLTATAFGGTAPYSYGWSTGGTTATISGLGYGHYWINATDASGCAASRHAYLGYDTAGTSCFCTIEGIIYADANGNCSQETGEAGIAHTQVYCSGIGYTYTDGTGHYSFKVPSGTYTITETVRAGYPLSPCQLNGITVSVTAAAGCVNTINFANAVVPTHDMRISVSSPIPPVPGNTYWQQIVIVNEGTITEDSTYGSVKTDGQLLTPSFVPSGLFTGGSNFYHAQIPDILAPGQSKTIVSTYSVPTNIPIGTDVVWRDTTAHDTVTGTWLTDNTPSNNVCQHHSAVVASYDPNYKEVTPRGTGANGIITVNDTVLEYTVHFQNTGSWYAQNIVVIDTLDNDLEWTSLHPIYESAPCRVSLSQSGSVKVARFSFDNINLPPQMFDDYRSNGMFTYSIKTKPGLAIGTQFKNRASIYFDYNAPIVTNTTINTIGTAGPVVVTNNNPSGKTAGFTVYPNPANTVFYIAISSDKNMNAEMQLTDMTGKTLLTRTVELQAGAQNIGTDINSLSAGVYFVSVKANGILSTQKLVIVK
jgi:uncharacterized repeat protein (TIGR01451 family)